MLRTFVLLLHSLGFQLGWSHMVSWFWLCAVHSPALCCQHRSRAHGCVWTRSRPWMRAHLLQLRKAHGQVVNKWKWKIAATCWTRSSTCRRWRWSGHDECPVSLLFFIWSTPPPPHTIYDNRNTDGHWSLAGEQNCLCAKLPLEWEILFICWMDPIMVLEFRCIVNNFQHNNRDLTLQRSNLSWCWTYSEPYNWARSYFKGA